MVNASNDWMSIYSKLDSISFKWDKCPAKYHCTGLTEFECEPLQGKRHGYRNPTTGCLLRQLWITYRKEHMTHPNLFSSIHYANARTFI
ncbi:hypothetical protein Y032_0720g1815 [Ancylostoma ceylanicum]|uniref:Uncharacterized protein n=1 Tax=Ancylostoma ceylanicum TaxID=53326 RepID=A0A016WH92_9BILA|nr:hypothetical protein Y032_0720g1815 [Ancylostoma ceylanicum]